MKINCIAIGIIVAAVAPALRAQEPAKVDDANVYTLQTVPADAQAEVAEANRQLEVVVKEMAKTPNDPSVQNKVAQLERDLAEKARDLAERAAKLDHSNQFKLYLDNSATPFKYRSVQGWWNAVDQYSRLTSDSTSMAVAAVLQATELLKPRGANAQIEYFESLLPQVKNETVRRAIRLQLIDAYKAANNQDKALDELQTLITTAPKGK